MDLYKDKYKRRPIRLQGYEYNQEGLYFVTICTHKSEDLFYIIADGKPFLNKFGNVIEKFWKKIPERYPNSDIDPYIIMPNHFHGIIQ